MQFDFLSTVVAWLDAAGIPHMLAGSMASTFHGEPRMTRDIDMVIDPTPKSMDRFAKALDRSRYYIDDAADAVRRRGMCNVIDTETGWKVDLIVRKERPFSREEFGRRQPAVIGGVRLFVASAEDTVLAKLEWRARSDSERQFRDVVAILAVQDLDHDYLHQWAEELGVAVSLDQALAAAGR
jgi:nucleotidyltransferase AbiEii toxin of type IV toxin-antitoxin system